MKTLIRAKTIRAFTLTELVVVSVIFGLLAAIILPQIVRARDSARLNTIYINLRTLEHAKEEWACEHRKGAGATVGDVQTLADYLRGRGVKNVVNEQYIPNPVGTPAGAQLPPDVSVGPFGPGAFIPAP